jgi:trigger factor
MDPRQLEYYKHTQLAKKAIDLIVEKSNVVEVTPEADEPTEEEGVQA